MRLEKQVCVITGGGKGIGAGIAKRFGSEGGVVVVADIDADAGRNVAEDVKSRGGHATAIQTDIASADSRNELFAAVMKEFGRIDVLVNNAAHTSQSGFFDIDERGWNRIMSINAGGTFFCMQAASREMVRAGKGRIVNIASIAAKGSRETNNIAYAASKGAVISLTRVAAMTLAPHGIRVNAVCPGSTDTPLMRSVLHDRAAELGITEDALLQRKIGRIPIGQMNTVDDVANAVVFLASQESATITGQSLNVCGGTVFD